VAGKLRGMKVRKRGGRGELRKKWGERELEEGQQLQSVKDKPGNTVCFADIVWGQTVVDRWRKKQKEKNL